MRVLVTGGAGFIGSHACKALAEWGHQPIVYDNLHTGHRDAVRWGPLVVGDILDFERLEAAFAVHKPEMVMHFAALAYVGESVTDPASYYRVNIGGTLSLLNAMVRHKLQAMVFSSTCATYGIPPSLPIDESTVQSPINPYGCTKLTVERMLADFEVAHGVKSVALRYFNAAGADPDGELGERHDPETHAVPLAIKAALGLGPKFSVLGTDYPTPDGSAIRDYVHVSDLADAHVKAIHHLEAGGESAAFNLATGVGTSVLEIVNAVTEATRKPVPVSHLPRRPGDPAILFADAKRAREELKWKPRFVTTIETVDTAVRFFRSGGLKRQYRQPKWMREKSRVPSHLMKAPAPRALQGPSVPAHESVSVNELCDIALSGLPPAAFGFSRVSENRSVASPTSERRHALARTQIFNFPSLPTGTSLADSSHVIQRTQERHERWVDHSQLPPIEGKIERFLLNSHGELDGLILDDGTEVYFPPYLSESVRRTFKLRSSVAIRGLQPRAAPVVAAIALQTVPCGPAIVDQGPEGAARHKRRRQALEVAGTITRVLHGPKGEVRGALLGDGAIVRLGNHTAGKLAKLLVVGAPLAARGEGVNTTDGSCLEAHFIGTSLSVLTPAKRKSELKELKRDHRSPIP